MSGIGTFIVVFLVVGVLSFLIIPVFMGFWTTARFTRRFERLLQAGYVDVVLVRPQEDETRNAGRRNLRNTKVSAASLCELWMDIRSGVAHGLPTAGGGIEAEKRWKPISLSIKTRDAERPTSVRDAILTTREQRKEASEMHARLRIAAHQHLYQQPTVSLAPVSPHDPHSNLEASSGTKSENISSQAKKAGTSMSVNPSSKTAATVRMCVFILMPSADNPNIQKKRVSAPASGLAVGPGLSSGIQPRAEEANNNACEVEVNANRIQEGSDGQGRSQTRMSQRDILQTQTMLPDGANVGSGVVPTVAMGVLTSNLEDASEIIASHTNNGSNPSLVSLDDDDETPMGARVGGTRVLYPIIYGARPMVVATTRPLGYYGRSRFM